MTAPHAPRLLYFTARYWPGSMAIPVHAELVRALTARGFTGAIVTLAPPGQREPVRGVPDGDLPVYRVSTGANLYDRLANRLSGRRFGYPYLATVTRYLRPWLARRAAAYPDTIFQLELAFPGGAIGRRASQGLPLRAVVSLHGGDVLVAPDGSYGFAREQQVVDELHRVLNWADATRAMSPLLASRARDLGCPAARLLTIPPNISDSFFPTEPLGQLRARAARALRDRLGLPPEATILLASGRVLPIKGFETLLDALPRVRQAVPTAQLVLYGPDRGEGVAHLRARAAALGVERAFTHLGQVPFGEQGDLLAGSDLAIAPSLLDGFNKFGAEAGASGTPIVASDASGIAHYVSECGAGRVVSAGAPESLAMGIIELLLDPQAWAQSSAGAARLASLCRTDRVADQLAALYQGFRARSGGQIST